MWMPCLCNIWIIHCQWSDPSQLLKDTSSFWYKLDIRKLHLLDWCQHWNLDEPGSEVTLFQLPVPLFEIQRWSWQNYVAKKQSTSGILRMCQRVVIGPWLGPSIDRHPSENMSFMVVDLVKWDKMSVVYSYIHWVSHHISCEQIRQYISMPKTWTVAEMHSFSLWFI